MATPPTEASVLAALKAVKDPDLHKDIVSLGFIKDLKIEGGRVAFAIQLTTPACPVKDQMKAQAEAAVRELPGVDRVEIEMTASVRAVATCASDAARTSRRMRASDMTPPRTKIHFTTPDFKPLCGLTRMKNPILTDIIRFVTCKFCLTIMERERRFGNLWTDQTK